MSAGTKGVHGLHTLTSTEGVTSSDALTPTEGTRGVGVFHVYLEDDLEMADTYGLQVKSMCGRWSVPGHEQGGPLEGNAYHRQVRLCRNCTRTREYRR